MKPILNWIKTNVYTVIFLAVMIAAPVAFWILAGRMNESVRDKVAQRADKIDQMNRLEKTSVSFNNPVAGNDPISATIAINRRFLDRYEQIVAAIRVDADRVREEILRINQKDRGVLLPQLFPEPPMTELETLPLEMYEALIAAYQRLLEDVEAGSPPSIESMQEALVSARERYTTQTLITKDTQLSEEDQAWLTEQLTETRLSLYAEQARGLGLYADMSSLDVPYESEIPESAADDGENSRMFDWQWQYWIKQDVLMALRAANERYESVVDAPVKRLLLVRVLDKPGDDAGSASGGGGGNAPTGGFGVGGAPAGRRGRAGGGGGSGGGKAAVPANPSRQVPLDFSASLTGRKTNPLYDVRRVQVEVIVDTARIPELFDALAAENFMTILDAVVEDVDLFEVIQDGYFYGAAPVSRLILQLETIWARKWTSEFMPAELKQSLGIPIENKPKTP